MNLPGQPPSVVRNYRWVICALLFFSTTFNYLDRQVISYLHEFFCRPVAEGGFGWSNTDFAWLTSCFTACYGGMTLGMGWIIDRIGTKLGLALSLIVWSLCGIANAFVGRLLLMHIMIRSVFAAGEAAISRHPSKRSPSGFRNANAPWPRPASTAVRILAP
jgi:ACS family hexuronate transporter-like MFS transporter